MPYVLFSSFLCSILSIHQAALAKDVKNELEAALDILSGKGKGAKGKAPRGSERKKMWEEVRALRKECVLAPFELVGLHFLTACHC